MCGQSRLLSPHEGTARAVREKREEGSPIHNKRPWCITPPSSRSFLFVRQETVLAALQRARTLFPFPILGIDTDNGGEFINERVIAYCEQEQITFTRGRPSLKNDQYPSVSFPFNVAQRGCFGPRGGHPIRHQCCTPCTKGRKGENASLAGGTPRKTPSKESGSRSCPGW